MRLLATVLGQDLETGDDGALRIAQKVAADRVISTVDPQAGQAQKTSPRASNGKKPNVAVDPDSEIITAPEVTAGNAGDAAAAADLIADLTTAAGDHNDDEPGTSAAVYGDSA